METKHTKEYAQLLSNGLIPKNNKDAFVEGYMAAINNSAAPELLEALLRVNKFIEQQNLDYESSMVKQIRNVIKKATE